MKAPGKDMMNTLQRGVLTLYGYDDMADDISIPNVLRQCLQLTSTVPLLAVYGYQAYNHYVEGKSFYIHSPKQELSTADEDVFKDLLTSVVNLQLGTAGEDPEKKFSSDEELSEKLGEVLFALCRFCAKYKVSGEMALLKKLEEF